MAEQNTDYGIVPTYKAHEYVWIRNRVHTDLLALDDEIIETPTLIQQAGEITCTAIEVRETTKNELEYVLSQSGEQLRNIPLPAGQRRSETAISSQIYLSPEVQAKQNELSEARLNASLWSNLTESLKSKNMGIRVAADLINSGWLTSQSVMDKRRKDIREVKT